MCPGLSSPCYQDAVLLGQGQSKDVSVTSYYISAISKQNHTPRHWGSGLKHKNGGGGGHNETHNRNLSKISASIKIEFEPRHVTRGARGKEPDGGRGDLSLTSAPRLHPSLARLPQMLPSSTRSPRLPTTATLRLWKTNMERARLPRPGPVPGVTHAFLSSLTDWRDYSSWSHPDAKEAQQHALPPRPKHSLRSSEHRSHLVKT